MPITGVFKHMLGEAAYDGLVRGIGMFWGKFQEQGVQMAVGAIKKTLEDARHLVVPYFQKLGESGKEGAQAAAENFFRNQRERQEEKLRWDGEPYRPGDENRFMSLVAKFYLAMETKPVSLPSITLNVSVGSKAVKPPEQIVREALAELQKELQVFLIKAQAVAGDARTPEEERDKFFIWLFNEPDERIEAVLSAVDHDPIRQFARRVGQDVASGARKTGAVIEDAAKETEKFFDKMADRLAQKRGGSGGRRPWVS